MVPRVVEHAVAESHHVVVGHRGVAVTVDAMYLPIRGLYDSDPGTWPTRLLDRNRRRRRVGGDGVHGAAYRCSTGCNTGLATDRPLVLYSYVRWPSRGRAWMLLRECGGGEDTTSTTELSPHRQAEEPENTRDNTMAASRLCLPIFRFYFSGLHLFSIHSSSYQPFGSMFSHLRCFLPTSDRNSRHLPSTDSAPC